MATNRQAEADLEAVPAFQAYVPKKHVPAGVGVDTEHLTSYWLVGAFFNGEEGWDGPIGDQTDRFIADGSWVNGDEGKYVDLVSVTDMAP